MAWPCPRPAWSCLARATCSTSPRPCSRARCGSRSKVSAFLSDFRDLKVGDYVVHVEHGIGLYQGLKEITQGDGTRRVHAAGYAEDAPALRAAGPAWTWWRSTARHEGAKPPLDHLGGATWERTKTRVKKAMHDMAEELLQALRRAQNGARATPSRATRHWQREFEDAFEFEETPDQAQAIADIKRDLEAPSPWTACSAATWATARPKSPCAPPSRRCKTAGRWRCWPPPRCWPSSTYETFRQRFAAFPSASKCSAASAPPRQQKEILQRRRGRAGGHPDRHAPAALQGRQVLATSGW